MRALLVLKIGLENGNFFPILHWAIVFPLLSSLKPSVALVPPCVLRDLLPAAPEEGGDTDQ